MTFDSWLPALWNDKSDRRDPFQALRKQMDEAFNDWVVGLPRGAAPFGGEAFQVRIDVSETETDITLKADLPGMEQKDIEVALVGNQLTIKGERKSEAEKKSDDKGRTYHRIERSYGAFQRIMALPFETDPGKVDAKFKDGVLTIVLPKPPEVQKQSRRIEVKKAA
ncbi:MAG: Hsp20/alpha crystallin family protein [Hyphomicrobiaceae bacterium]